MSLIKSVFSLGKEKKLKITRNVFWLILLNGFVAVSQLVIYASINRTLGKEILGIWSIVVACTLIGQISALGVSYSLVRLVPEYHINRDINQITRLVGTVLFGNLAIGLPVMALLYFPAVWYAHHLLNHQFFAVFSPTFQWAAAGIYLFNIYFIYSCLFDGVQKFYIRCIIQITGCILFLLLLYYLMPAYGLVGVGISFFLQNCWQLIAAVFLSKKLKIIDRALPVCFDKESFKKTYAIGARYQMINILLLFFDPLIKFFITRYIGLSGAANYELANKITLQGRNLLHNTNLIITPKMVVQRKQGTEALYFDNALSKNILYAVAMGMATLVFSPLAVLFFSPSFDFELMMFIAIINMGWVCNMITSVHYYSCMGLDKMNQLVIIHFIYAAMAALLYLFFGMSYVSAAVFLSVPSISLFFGSVYNSYVLKKSMQHSFSWLVSPAFLFFLLASASIIFISFESIWMLILSLAAVFIVFISLFGKKILMSWSDQDN